MARVQVQAEHFSVKQRSRDPATCVGSLPAAFCSPADTEVAAGRPKPVSPLKDSCSGLAWPAITRGKEETQTPPSLLGRLRHRGGMLRLGTQPATSGAVCRFKGWDGGWETRPQVELLYGRGAPYPWWEAQGEGASETESQHGWDRRESRAGQRPSVPMVITSRRRERRRKGSRCCPWLSTLSPIPVSGSCRSVFVGTILSSFYDYGFGCVFCKVYTLNVVCEVIHWDGGFMKQE